jgi:hypothetical protein
MLFFMLSNHYAECWHAVDVLLNVIMLCIVMLRVVIKPVVLSVVMLNVMGSNFPVKTKWPRSRYSSAVKQE